MLRKPVCSVLVAAMAAAVLAVPAAAGAAEPSVPLWQQAVEGTDPTPLPLGDGVFPSGAIGAAPAESCPVEQVAAPADVARDAVIDAINGAVAADASDVGLDDATVRLSASLDEQARLQDRTKANVASALIESLLSEETLVAMTASVQGVSRPATVPDDSFLGHFRISPYASPYETGCRTRGGTEPAVTAGARAWEYGQDLFVDMPAPDGVQSRVMAKLLVDGAPVGWRFGQMLPIRDAAVPTWLVATGWTPYWSLVTADPAAVRNDCMTLQETNEPVLNVLSSVLQHYTGLPGYAIGLVLRSAFDPFPCYSVDAVSTPLPELTGAEFSTVDVAPSGTRLASQWISPEHAHVVAVWDLSLAARRATNPLPIALGNRCGIGLPCTPVVEMSDDGSTVAMCTISGVRTADWSAYGYEPVVWREAENRLIFPGGRTGGDPACGDLRLTADGSRLSYAFGPSQWDTAWPSGSWLFDTTRAVHDPPVDADPPVLTAPAAVAAEATGPDGAAVAWEATAADAHDGPVPVVCAPASGSVLPLGRTTVECTAADAAGNTAGAVFDVSVLDTVPPALSLPRSVVTEATGPSGAAVAFEASADDLVSGAVPVVCSARATGSVLPIGTTTVQCTAADGAGNTARGMFEATVRDTTAPALAVPAALTVDATGPGGAVVDPGASAVDLVDGPVPVVCAPAAGSVLPIGTTTVACTAADAAGNTESGAVAVTVLGAEDQAVLLVAETAASGGASGAVALAESAAESISADRVLAADGQLAAFAAMVEATSPVGGDALVARAERIRAVLAAAHRSGR